MNVHYRLRKINVPFVRRFDQKKLEITLMNDDIHAFIDVDDEGVTFQINESLSYSVLEVMGESRYVVISIQFVEVIDFLLLDRKTYVYHKLKVCPVFSPDGRKLLVANTDFSGLSQAVLEIYEVKDQTTQLEYAANLGDEWSADWGGESIVWHSSSIITFTMVTINCSIYETMPCEKKLLKYGKSGWELLDVVSIN
ncbi:MAG TPA: hypothetical protein VL995_01915 [Cellvibrio sp.]|nr:hypothetical protein [Cellvibrio sp.]